MARQRRPHGKPAPSGGGGAGRTTTLQVPRGEELSEGVMGRGEREQGVQIGSQKEKGSWGDHPVDNSNTLTEKVPEHGTQHLQWLLRPPHTACKQDAGNGLTAGDILNLHLDRDGDSHGRQETHDETTGKMQVAAHNQPIPANPTEHTGAGSETEPRAQYGRHLHMMRSFLDL